MMTSLQLLWTSHPSCTWPVAPLAVCRSQYMSFEFNCRTSDNVEMILEGTFFWGGSNRANSRCASLGGVLEA